MELTNLLIDPAKISGTWIVWNDAKIKIRYADAPEVKEYIIKMLIENQKGGEIDAATFAETNKHKIIANAILLDWEGFQMSGENYPFSIENAEFLLQRVPDLLWTINLESVNLKNFRETVKRTTTKNSKRS